MTRTEILKLVREKKQIQCTLAEFESHVCEYLVDIAEGAVRVNELQLATTCVQEIERLSKALGATQKHI